MPTYEYECTRCGLVFEEFQSISAPPRRRCPECRCKVERLISGGTGILFKGSGFYKNDSRGNNAGAKSGEAAESPAGSAPAAGEAGGSTGAAPASGD